MPRLTIQYSIELEEIERETVRLMSKAIDTLSCLTELDIMNMDIMSYSSLERIDQIRKKLNRADHNLNDTYQIIDGYLRYKAASSLKQEADNYQEEQNEIPASD
jgi:hypothetical protein